jgi:hypothetical protein
MKIIGLFVVVFSIAIINKWLGFTDMASMIGVTIGAGLYLLLNIKDTP